MRSNIVRLALLSLLAATHHAGAANVLLSDSDFPDTSWTVIDGSGAQLEVGQDAPGNPGFFRRLRITFGAGGQLQIVNHSPAFLFDQGAEGTITGVSISFDAIRLDAGSNDFYVSAGTFENGSYHQANLGLAGAGWQHYEFECISVVDLDLGSGAVQFAFAFTGFTPFVALDPAYEIGIDNFRVQLQTAPDTCDGFSSGSASIAGTDNGHLWASNPVIPYVLTLTNLGSDAVPAVQVTDFVPVRTSFDAAASTPGWSCAAGGGAGDACTATVSDIPAGDSRSITFAARVVDGTPQVWDVFNEARIGASPPTLGPGQPIALRVERATAGATTSRAFPSNATCTSICTKGVAATIDQLCQGNALGSLTCCAVAAACLVLPNLSGCESSCSQCVANLPPAGPQPLVPAPRGVEPVRFELLYRLRDRVFHGTAGGERATALYYQHSAALAAAFQASPSLAIQAIDTLRLWQPAILAVVEGSAATVTAERVQALAAFLDALRPVASPALAAAIDHGRRRLDLANVEGTTLTGLLADLGDLVCSAEASYPSVRCRLEDGGEMAAALPGELAGKIVTSLERAGTLAGEAASAAEDGDKRGARRRLATVKKLSRSVVKRAQSRRAKRDFPAEARTELIRLLNGLTGDLKALVRATGRR